MQQQFPRRFPPLQCHYCKKIGHKQVDCFYFFKDSRRQLNNGGGNSFGSPYPHQSQSLQSNNFQGFSPMPKINLQTPGLHTSEPLYSGVKRQRNESRNEQHQQNDERFGQRFDDTLQDSSHNFQNNNQHQPQQEEICRESCCQPQSSPQQNPGDEFTESIRYMARMRDELGKEKFKDFQAETFLGKKVHKALVDIENDL